MDQAQMSEEMSEQGHVAKLQQQVALLSDKVEQQRREHAALMVQLEESNQAKMAFFANMGHEIRTPMNAITGFSQLMMATSLTEKQHYYLQQITEGSDGLLRLMNALFDLSKLQSGSFQLEYAPFVLDALVDRLQQRLLPEAEKKGLRLVVEMGSTIPNELNGDGARIYQVLFHLVENAIKFSAQGTVKLQIAFTPVAQCFEAGLGRLGIVVKDRGIGIDEALISRLFTPFSLGDDSLTRQQGGSGLGLAICHHILLLMGGTITVNSRRGEGSEFRVEIPLNCEACVEKYAPPSRKSLEGCRVLLVDDRVINREIANDVLSDWGVVVVEAENGADALTMLQQERCDLVLMDILMPVMGGLEAARRIRQQDEFALLPIIAMTGNSSERDRLECLAAGMNDVLVKPINFDALPQQMLHWINGDEQALSQDDDVDSIATNSDAVQHHLPSLLPAIVDEDRDKAVRKLGGNITLYYQLLQYFPLEHAQTSEQIHGAIAQHDVATAQRLAHTLKSSAASLGARLLMDSAGQIEQMFRAGEMPVAAQLQTMGQHCTQLMQVLSDRVDQAEQMNEASNHPLSHADCREKIAQLSLVLKHGEECAIAMLEDLLPQLRSMNAADAERVRQLVDGFDFVAAATLLQQMAKSMQQEEE